MFLRAEADIGLSERGLRGAKKITSTLALHFPAAITRSPMRRALETPNALRPGPQPPRTSSRELTPRLIRSIRPTCTRRPFDASVGRCDRRAPADFSQKARHRGREDTSLG